MDVESGMKGQCAMDWAAAHGIHLKFKAPRQKAWIVERHNALIRNGAHRTEQQLIKEEVRCTFEQVLAIVTFMKNALTVINSSTPYQALFGRQPAMLPPLEGGHPGQVLAQSRVETNSKNEARVREVAAINIIEATAEARLERVDRYNTRGAMELQDLKPSDIVDIWFEPSTKDMVGWRGPAEILSMNLAEGNYSVRYQGRTLIMMSQEVRPHIAFFTFLCLLHEEVFAQWLFIRDYVEQFKRGFGVVLGVVVKREDNHKYRGAA